MKLMAVQRCLEYKRGEKGIEPGGLFKAATLPDFSFWQRWNGVWLCLLGAQPVIVGRMLHSTLVRAVCSLRATHRRLFQGESVLRKRARPMRGSASYRSFALESTERVGRVGLDNVDDSLALIKPFLHVVSAGLSRRAQTERRPFWSESFLCVVADP